MGATVLVRFDHAPFSPFVREGMLARHEFEAVTQEVDNVIAEVVYRLRPAQMCEGISVPELQTEQVVIKAASVVVGGGSGNIMY